MSSNLTLRALLAVCDEISPFDLQESWDNSGLILGDPNEPIEAVAVSLEADESAIAATPNGAALIAHHPLIFSPQKRLDLSAYPAKLLALAIRKNISLIAMHTNFDKTHLNKFAAKNILGFEDFLCENFICIHEKKESFEDILKRVENAFGEIKSFVKPKINALNKYRAALCVGSGGSFLDEKIDAEVLITGDLKYHDAVKANSLGIGVIDAGHYETERHFPLVLAAALKEKGINAIIAPSKNPLLRRKNDEQTP